MSVLPFPALSQPRKEDSLALVALYESTGGENWRSPVYSPNNWLTAAPLHEWSGVKVENDRVTEIDISNKDLVGVIPDELANLTNLRVLDLHNNQIGGQLPRELSSLSSLEVLRLGRNHLKGILPPGIWRISSLRVLSIENNELTKALSHRLCR